MNTPETHPVLIVTEEPVEINRLESAVPGVSVTVLTDLTDVFERLTNDVYHCLVLPAQIEDQAGPNIAHGITEMFPDLPVVIAGVDPESVAGRENVVGVESADLVGKGVADAVRAALDDEPPSVAGRPPSPMETLLLSLFDEMPDHFYAKDEDARHVLMGRGFNEPTDRLGLTDPEVEELQDDHGEAALRDEMDVIENRRDGIDVEEFLDLSASYVRTRKVPWYDADGEIQGIVGHTQDITEEKAREHAFHRQHERLVKTALVASHEFRNELQVALGRLEELDCEDEHLEHVRESLDRLETMVDTVVELSTREDTHGTEKPVWLSRLSREIWDTLAEGEATLEIENDARVLADQDAASLLLQTLFRNALDHGGPDVTIRVGTTPEGFYVADDGPGIDVDPPERVFDAGFTTVEENTGLGLYVAQTVADENDWTITVDGDGAEGACFEIGNVDLDRWSDYRL